MSKWPTVFFLGINKALTSYQLTVANSGIQLPKLVTLNCY